MNQEQVAPARRILRNYISEGRLVSEELITERRLECLGDLDHTASSLAAKQQVEEQGFAVCEGLLSTELVERLIDALARIDQVGAVRQRGGIFAVRNLLDVCPEVRSPG